MVHCTNNRGSFIQDDWREHANSQTKITTNTIKPSPTAQQTTQLQSIPKSLCTEINEDSFIHMDSALRSHRTPINILQTQVDVLTWDYSMYNIQMILYI